MNRDPETEHRRRSEAVEVGFEPTEGLPLHTLSSTGHHRSLPGASVLTRADGRPATAGERSRSGVNETKTEPRPTSAASHDPVGDVGARGVAILGHRGRRPPGLTNWHDALWGDDREPLRLPQAGHRATSLLRQACGIWCVLVVPSYMTSGFRGQFKVNRLEFRAYFLTWGS